MAPTVQGKRYTREEAAEILEMSLATFDRKRQAGLIEEIRLGPHKIRFTEEALNQYLRDCTKPRNAANSSDSSN